MSIPTLLLLVLCAVSHGTPTSLQQKYPSYKHEWSSVLDTFGLLPNREWARPQSDEDFDSIRAHRQPAGSKDHLDDTHRVLYSEVPMSSLVYQCIKTIPARYRERCLFNSFERYAGSVFPGKSRCCTKWSQIKCLEEYAYNSLYCNLHERVAVSRYFKKVRSLDADGSPECRDYRPVDEEIQLWGSEAGRVPKCALGTKQELKL